MGAAAGRVTGAGAAAALGGGHPFEALCHFLQTGSRRNVFFSAVGMSAAAAAAAGGGALCTPNALGFTFCGGVGIAVLAATREAENWEGTPPH